MSTTVALLLLVGSGSVPLPDYDVDAMCAAHFRAVVQDVAKCVKLEQESYDDVRFRWDELTDAERQRAIKAADAQSYGRYFTLEVEAVNILAAHLDEVHVPKFRR